MTSVAFIVPLIFFPVLSLLDQANEDILTGFRFLAIAARLDADEALVAMMSVLSDPVDLI